MSDKLPVRPRVKLEEMRQGQGYVVAVCVMIIVVLGLFAAGVGGLQVLGKLHEPDSPNVYAARQQDFLAESYQEYVDEYDETQDQSGVVLIICAPLLCALAAMLYYGAVAEVTKCPKGHVIRKEHSYCPVCAAAIYTKEELSPDEWRKRYEPTGEAK
jgi:hypothetical protein